MSEQTIDLGGGKVVRIRRRKLKDYQPDRMNVNAGSERGQRAIERSIRELGSGRSIVVDADGEVIAGNHALQGFVDSGFEEVVEIETEGGVVVAHRRSDLNLDGEDSTARRLALADNRTTELSYTVDAEVFAEVLKRDTRVADGLWTEAEIAKLLKAGDERGKEKDVIEDMDANLGVFKLDENVIFPSGTKHQLPELDPEMIPDLDESLSL